MTIIRSRFPEHFVSAQTETDDDRRGWKCNTLIIPFPISGKSAKKLKALFPDSFFEYQGRELHLLDTVAAANEASDVASEAYHVINLNSILS